MNEILLDPAFRQQPAQTRREQFTFNGSAGEYFGIWIVNVLLTILTVGIYSAWAKVRRQRYFYGNTALAGASFDYHARPKQILLGRLMVIFLLILYNVLLTVAPIAGLGAGLLFLFASPWFIMRGLRFTARVTSYRNVRFDFTGGYAGALLAYVAAPIVAFVSLGILAPIASRWTWRYTLGNLRYGDRPVRTSPTLGKLYGQWWFPALVFILGLIIVILLAISVTAISAASADGASGIGNTGWATVLYLPSFTMLLLAGVIYRAGVRNVVFNATVIDDRHRLASSIGRRRFTWITVSNLVATVFTLGLARPWAAIRMARYVAQTTALDASGSLEDYSSALVGSGSAVGSEYMDLEGFDFGF